MYFMCYNFCNNSLENKFYKSCHFLLFGTFSDFDQTGE